MIRRDFLTAAVAALAPAAAPSAKQKTYRAAVIGHTGHGNYGHGLDIVWNALDNVELVALADPDEEGRAKAIDHTGAPRAYADYREMLEREKPDLVSIGPRWTDQRVEMVTAAAEARAHIFLEKPFAGTLADADKMVEAVDRHSVKVQIAHQMRRSLHATRVRELLESGEIGEIQEIRGRGKEDGRAGGEDLVVLGCHIFDLLRMLAGDPKWVFAHVTEDGQELAASHRRAPSEAIGPIAANQMAAMFDFGGGVHAYFSSKASGKTHAQRFGIAIYGSRGVIYLPFGTRAKHHARLLRAPGWMPTAKVQWEPVERVISVPGTDQIDVEDRELLNALLAYDLIEAIEQDREPVCSAIDGRWTTEMITGVYQSQLSGARVAFPLKDRRHPVEAWS